jgi:glutathione peroxidase
LKKLFFLFFLTIPFYSYSQCPEILDHDIRVLASSESRSLCDFKDKVILAVNVASQCGYTYQYESLQSLYSKYKSKDFVVLGFPSNDFFQERAKDEDEVKEFCKTTYGVDFPMFKRSHVKTGGGMIRKSFKPNSFFEDLIKETGIEPTWNFNKYLISKDGKVLHFDQKVEPDSEQLLTAISLLL